MKNADVNIGDLERFRSHLRLYSQDLQKRRALLVNALELLGDGWNDSQRQQFDDRLKQALSVLDRLTRRVDEVEIPFLNQKIKAGNAYLRR